LPTLIARGEGDFTFLGTKLIATISLLELQARSRAGYEISSLSVKSGLVARRTTTARAPTLNHQHGGSVLWDSVCHRFHGAVPCGPAYPMNVWFQYGSTLNGLVEALTLRNDDLRTRLFVYGAFGGPVSPANNDNAFLLSHEALASRSRQTYFILCLGNGVALTGPFSLTWLSKPASPYPTCSPAGLPLRRMVFFFFTPVIPVGSR